MLVLEIILGIAVTAAIIFGFMKFEKHCEEKFCYRFFTKTSFVMVGASLLLLFFGIEWLDNSVQNHGDKLNGIILMALGVGVALFLIVLNFRNTNALYGIGGSVVQLSVCSILLYFGLFILIAGLALMFAIGIVGGNSSSRSSYEGQRIVYRNSNH